MNPKVKVSSVTKTRGAVLYTRVSTGEQDKHGTSPETQRDACRTKALELSLPIIAEYHDGGISGGFLLSRTGFQAALADIQEGRADTLICPSISRYSRDVEHQQAVKKSVKAAGGQLVFCDMNFEDTPEGDLNFTIQGGFAEYEKAVIRKRTMSGKRKRAESGQQPSRATSPYGYRIVTKADALRGDYPHTLIGQYQVVEDEAAVVREIFARYAAGQSLNQISRWLNEGGIPTRGSQRTNSKSDANSKAVYWRPNGIRYILKNTVYRGEAHFGQREHRKTEGRLFETNPATGQPYKQDIVRRPAAPENVVDLACPPLVDTDTWNAVNALLPGNQNSGGNPALVRMLTGKVFCPQCGGRVVSGAGGRNSYVSVRGETLYYPRERRYLCMTSQRQRCTVGTHSCTGESYQIKRVEQATVAAILDAAEKPQSIQEAVTAFHAAKAVKEAQQPASGHDTAAVRREKAKVEDALARLDTRQEATVKAQIAGIMAGADASAYSSVFADIAAERKDLEDRRGQLARELKTSDPQEKSPTPKAAQRGQESKEDFAARALTLAYGVLTSDAVPSAKKREIIGSLIDRVICQKDGAKVVFLPGAIEAENSFSAGTVQPMSMIFALTRI